MPAAKNSSTSVSREAIDDQAAQAVALGMDQAIGVGDGVEPEQVAAQPTACGDPAGEEGVVDGLVRVGASARAGRCASGRCRSRGRPTAPSRSTMSTTLPGGLRAPASRPSSGRSTDATSGARS